MRENAYQARLIRKLKRRFPDCVIVKNDPDYMQGIPDLTIFWGPGWGMLETKASEHAPERPNQGYYVELFDRMSFAAFIYPENEREVLDALQQSLESRWPTRLLER